MRRWLVIGWGLIILGMAARGFGQETPANLVRLGGGLGFPSNGAGWITDHLQQGTLGTAGYDRFLSPRWALEAGISYLRNTVDTGGTEISNISLYSDTLGFHLGARAELITKNRVHLYSDAGVGYYQSSLQGDRKLEDSATGYGIPVGLGADLMIPPGLSLGLRAGYLPLFMSTGASFDSLEIQFLVGAFWGQTKKTITKPPADSTDSKEK